MRNGSTIRLTLAALAVAAVWLGLRTLSAPGTAPQPEAEPHAAASPRQAAPASARAARIPAAGRAPASVVPAREPASAQAAPGGAQELSELVSPGFRFHDPYADYPVLSFHETPKGPGGDFVRSKVVRTRMKYPLILVEERFRRDPASGEDRLEQRRAMVADHVIVTLRDGRSEEELQSLAGRHGASITRRLSPDSRSYILQFEAAETGTLRQMISELQRSPIVASPEPDYVVRR